MNARTARRSQAGIRVNSWAFEGPNGVGREWGRSIPTSGPDGSSGSRAPHSSPPSVDLRIGPEVPAMRLRPVVEPRGRGTYRARMPILVLEHAKTPGSGAWGGPSSLTASGSEPFVSGKGSRSRPISPTTSMASSRSTAPSRPPTTDCRGSPRSLAFSRPRWKRRSRCSGSAWAPVARPSPWGRRRTDVESVGRPPHRPHARRSRGSALPRAAVVRAGRAGTGMRSPRCRPTRGSWRAATIAASRDSRWASPPTASSSIPSGRLRNCSSDVGAVPTPPSISGRSPRACRTWRSRSTGRPNDSPTNVASYLMPVERVNRGVAKDIHH